MSTVTEGEPVAVSGVTYQRPERAISKAEAQAHRWFLGLVGHGVAVISATGLNGGIAAAGWEDS